MSLTKIKKKNQVFCSLFTVPSFLARIQRRINYIFKLICDMCTFTPNYSAYSISQKTSHFLLQVPSGFIYNIFYNGLGLSLSSLTKQAGLNHLCLSLYYFKRSFLLFHGGFMPAQPVFSEHQIDSIRFFKV